MAGTTSLVNQFDDIVAATGVLCAGTEGGERKLHGIVSEVSVICLFYGRAPPHSLCRVCGTSD